MYKPSFYSGSREQYRHRPIQVITARAFSCKVHEHSINLNFVALIILQTVCVLLLVNLTQVSNRISLSFIAISFNVMSLAPKINELAHVVLNADFALVCITEIWLQKHIPDSIVTMQGYNLIHLDRSEAVHRGVYVFLNEMIPFNILDDFTDKTYGLEVLWKKNQTNLTPKGIL